MTSGAGFSTPPGGRAHPRRVPRKDVFLILERIPVGPFQMNSYVVGCVETNEGAYVDPGAEVERVIAAARDRGLNLTKIIGTHAHLDHAEGVAEAKEKLSIPYWLHEAELFNLQNIPNAARGYGFPEPPVPEVDAHLVPGETISVGKPRIRDQAHRRARAGQRHALQTG